MGSYAFSLCVYAASTWMSNSCSAIIVLYRNPCIWQTVMIGISVVSQPLLWYAYVCCWPLLHFSTLWLLHWTTNSKKPTLTSFFFTCITIPPLAQRRSAFWHKNEVWLKSSQVNFAFIGKIITLNNFMHWLSYGVTAEHGGTEQGAGERFFQQSHIVNKCFEAIYHCFFCLFDWLFVVVVVNFNIISEKYR